jgi:hypothetical protein
MTSSVFVCSLNAERSDLHRGIALQHATLEDFNIALFEEHLQEASFLYEQRVAYLYDPELTWRDLDDYEGRYEAHIDALMVMINSGKLSSLLTIA